MRHGRLLAGFAALLGMGLASFSQAAAITSGLRLTDTANVAIPQDGSGNYILAPGQTFEVWLTAQVTSPNATDGFRSAANNGKSLGLQSLSVNIRTNDSVGKINPSGDGSGPPTWHNYTDQTPDGVGFAFTNLLDPDSDGDLDPSGAGIGITTTSLASSASATTLAKVQYGISGQTDLVSGEYSTAANIGPGIYHMVATIVSGFVYADPANTSGDSTTAKASITAVDVTNGSTNGSISIIIAPEPASIGLLGASALSLLGMRRRRVA